MQFIQFISVLLLGGVKFFLAIPLAVQYDFSFWETFIFSCMGGVLGVIVFAKFRKVVLKIYYSIYPFDYNAKKKKSFKNIIALKVARKYGLFGIAFLTPIFALLSGGLFLNERLTIIQWIGVVFVLMSVFFVSQRKSLWENRITNNN